MQLIEEISRWVMCDRCCHTGLIMNCCAEGTFILQRHNHPNPVTWAPCPDCKGTGWLDIDQLVDQVVGT
jgi:hypothetical protein